MRSDDLRERRESEGYEDMRRQTKKVHDLTITKYKSRYRQQYFDLVELVLHQSGICGEFLVLDSDYIAQHIKSGGHNITQGKYNNLYSLHPITGAKKYWACYRTKHEKQHQQTKCPASSYWGG